MKRILLASAFCGCGVWGCHAQGTATWVEQLAALWTLEKTVQQGYTTVKDGLTHIGEIRSDEYQLHSQYYGSLAIVNPAIQTDPKTVELVMRLNQLVLNLQRELAYWQNQQPINQP